MKIVYIAGRYTGATMIDVERNVHEARKVGLMLAEFRIPFFCPVIHTAFFDFYLGDKDPGYEYWIAQTMEQLKRCDAVFLVPNWKDSKGARGEVEYARAHGIPVFDRIDELAAWMED